MKIINLTQHQATPEQISAGVEDLPKEQRSALCALLTFDSIPSSDEVEERAEQIALLANAVADEAPDQFAMIGGAPYLMSALERALLDQLITPLYAFSVRESVEQISPDGGVRKVNVFRHAGFVRV